MSEDNLNSKKETRYRVIILILVLCLIAMGIAILSNGTRITTKTKDSSIPITDIVFDEPVVSLLVGDSYYAHATIQPENASDRAFELESSDENVVIISDGIIQAKSAGSAIVKASQNGIIYGQCVVKVTHIEPESVAFANSFEGKIGRTDLLKYTFTPFETTDTEMEYHISDDSLAHMEGSGIVYDAEGSITLTAKHKTTGLLCTAIIDITPVELESISIKDPGNVYIGDTIKLQAVFSPSDTTEKDYTWKNFENTYASFSDGELIAKKEGTITVQIKHTASKQVFSKEIEIKRIVLQRIKINLTEGQKFYIGDERLLSATPDPKNTSETNFTWKSSNPSVATISDEKLFAKKEGSATITVTDRISGMSVSVEITVSPIEASRISLSSSTKTLTVGNTATLSTTITPSNVTNPQVTWSSSNTKVATVSSKGVVTAKSAGSATITAKTTNNKTATCIITVKPKPVAITNGFINRPSGNCIAPVKINAPSNESVYVYFKSSTNKKYDFSMLVKAGTSCEVNAPTGKYTMYYASGSTWYGKEYKFGDDTQYFTSYSIFNFYTSGDYVYGTELTLYKVANGNMTTSEISESDFPE